MSLKRSPFGIQQQPYKLDSFGSGGGGQTFVFMSLSFFLPTTFFPWNRNTHIIEGCCNSLQSSSHTHRHTCIPMWTQAHGPAMSKWLINSLILGLITYTETWDFPFNRPLFSSQYKKLGPVIKFDRINSYSAFSVKICILQMVTI